MGRVTTYTTMSLYVRHETDGALLVTKTREIKPDVDKGTAWWLPKSQIRYDEDFQIGDRIDIEISDWILERKDGL